MEQIKLYNGMMIPAIGLGANGIWGGEEMKNSKLAQEQYDIYCYALKSNKCKLYDTSGAYGYNEEVLGDAIKDVGRRNDIYLMSKVANSSQRTGDIRAALERSLKRLGTDYLDLYLLHWPQIGTFVDSYLQMEKLYEEGLVKAIGVCNFNIHHIEELMYSANVLPMVNQFELHPLFTQDSLVNYCKYKDIGIIAYSPVGRMHDVLVKSKPIFELSKKYGKSAVEIILRWHYQRGNVSIPRTTNREHFEQIFSITDFELSEKEIYWINSVNQNIRLRYDPDNCDFSRL